MRYLLVLLVALSTFSAFPSKQASAAQDFEGDRIVIFRDDSDTFLSFERYVLYDPEVMSLINKNFDVYSIEAGGPAARTMPLLAGSEHTPRIVIVSPRLKNMMAVMSPSVQKSHFLTLLRAVKRATNLQELDLALGRIA